MGTFICLVLQVMIIRQPQQFAHNFLPDTPDCVYSSGLFSEGNLGSPSDNILKNVISTFFRFSELRSFSWWRHSLTGLSSEDCSGQLCKTYKSLPPGVVQYFRESSWYFTTSAEWEKYESWPNMGETRYQLIFPYDQVDNLVSYSDTLKHLIAI